MEKIKIDINKVREALDSSPKQKKAVQTALDVDRSVMSKILTNKRKLEGGELLTMSAVLGKNPFDFALEK